MMTDSISNAELAKRLQRRRARACTILSLFLILQQVTIFAHGDRQRLVDYVNIGLWSTMSALVLLLLTTGGFWFRSPEVRAMLAGDDTRANRAGAFRTGFLFAMITGIVLYLIQFTWEFSPGDGIQLIVTVGLVSALLHFSITERRSLGRAP